MEENKALNPISNEIAELNHADQELSYCSFVAETTKEKAQLFKIMNSPEKRVADCINEVIYVKDVFAEMVTCTNEQTGETTVCPRIVLIDKDGIGYQAVSVGLFGALKKLIAIFGSPTWDEPLPLKIKQIKNGAKNLLTFEVEAK